MTTQKMDLYLKIQETYCVEEFLLKFEPEVFKGALYVWEENLMNTLYYKGGPPLVDDLIQETYLQAVQKQKTYSLKKGGVFNWCLYLFKYYVAIPYLRRESDIESTFDALVEGRQEVELIKNQNEEEPYDEIIDELLSFCTDLQAYTIRETMFKGVSQRTFAKENNLKRTAVRNRVQHGISRIRMKLQENPELAKELELKATHSIFCRKLIEKSPDSGRWTSA